jgi:cyclase
MRRIRVIPTLLVQNGRLVKTLRFKNPVYVGDPINAVKIFNDKEIDEIIVLDIDASHQFRSPKTRFIQEIASECFMPMAYGGGITSVEQIRQIMYAGAEKVVLNSVMANHPQLVSEAARIFGNQSIVVSIDVKKSLFGNYRTYTRSGTVRSNLGPVAAAKRAVDAGAGEIYLNSIDRDGTMHGYDVELIRMVADAVSVPVIAAGGAKSIDDFSQAVSEGHASAVSAGSMFVFQGVHRAVLISYPQQSDLKERLFKKVA